MLSARARPIRRCPVGIGLAFVSYFSLISCTANHEILANLNAKWARFAGRLINLDYQINDGIFLG